MGTSVYIVEQTHDRKGNLIKQEIIGRTELPYDPIRKMVERLVRDWKAEDIKTR